MKKPEGGRQDVRDSVRIDICRDDDQYQMQINLGSWADILRASSLSTSERLEKLYVDTATKVSSGSKVSHNCYNYSDGHTLMPSFEQLGSVNANFIVNVYRRRDLERFTIALDEKQRH